MYLAWKSIEDERETLNLDAYQAGQARTKRQQADDTVRLRIPQTYGWLLVPTQPDPNGSPEWDQKRLQGDDPLAVRASRKLRSDGDLVPEYGPTLLRRELDRIPLWRGDHVGVGQLRDDFAQYLYLPRFRDGEVLLRSIRDGAALLTWESETFVYAEGWDEGRGRYLGLRAGATGSVVLDGESLVVKPEAARRQLDADATPGEPPSIPYPSPATGVANGQVGTGPGPDYGSDGTRTVVPTRIAPRRFHGSIRLDPARPGRDAARIADEVIAHLTGLVGTHVEITLEIHAEIPDGAPDAVVRTVTENCRTLRFTIHGFEET